MRFRMCLIMRGFKGPKDQGTQGPKDQGTKGPKVQRMVETASCFFKIKKKSEFCSFAEAY